MTGDGMESWLNYDGASPFRATRHAVRMERGLTRAWYGMMFLVPPDAVVQSDPVVRTFAQMRESVAMVTSDDNVAHNSLGCGRPLPRLGLPLDVGRRLGNAGHGDQSVCNNSTSFYCWMTCQDIPPLETAQMSIEAVVAGNYSLYCADSAADDDLAEGVEQCTKSGVVGASMNPACVGTWRRTEEGIPTGLYVSEALAEEQLKGFGTSNSCRIRFSGVLSIVLGASFIFIGLY